MERLLVVVRIVILLLVILVLGCKSKNVNNARVALNGYSLRLSEFDLQLEPYERNSKNSRAAFPDSISGYFSYKNYCHLKNDSMQVLIASNFPGEEVLVVFNTKANKLQIETIIYFTGIIYKKLSGRKFHCACSKLWRYSNENIVF